MSKQDNKLNEVRKAFANWRAQNHFHSQPVPSDLWCQAIELMDSYPLSRIAVALKLTILDMVIQVKALVQKRGTRLLKFMCMIFGLKTEKKRACKRG